MKLLRKWGLPLLTGAVVLAAVLLPSRISALRDRQTLSAPCTEPLAQEDLTLQETTLPEKLELLGRAIRYPELDVYSAAQPLEAADEQTRDRAEAAFRRGVEMLVEWGALPEALDRSTLQFQGGSRVVYVQAAGGGSAGMLYLQGETAHRDDLWMVVDEETGLPVWLDCTLRSCREELCTDEELGAAFCEGLGLEVWQCGPAIWEVESAGGLVYSASVQSSSGRICVEPLGFAWDLFGEHRQTGSAEEK